MWIQQQTKAHSEEQHNLHCCQILLWHAAAQFVEASCYKPKVAGSIADEVLHFPVGLTLAAALVSVLVSTWLLPQVSTRDVPGDEGAGA
jgi:UDP-galactopyranose mutase